MDRMHYPRGLIRLSTQNGVARGWRQSELVRRIFRPRVLIYGTALVAISTAMVASLALRTPLKVDVVRDRGTLSRIVAGGQIENIYRVQIGNATEQDQRYVLSASGIEGLRVASETEVDVGAAQDRWVVVRLQAPYGAAGPGSHGVEITATAVGDPALTKQAHSTFLVPR